MQGWAAAMEGSVSVAQAAAHQQHVSAGGCAGDMEPESVPANQNSSGDTTVHARSLAVDINGMGHERTPSSSPNSTSNQLNIQQSTSSKLDSAGAAVREGSPQSEQFQGQKRPERQQEMPQQRQGQNSSSRQHQTDPTTSADQQQEGSAGPISAGRSAQDALQAMQQQPGARMTAGSQQQQLSDGAGADEIGTGDEDEGAEEDEFPEDQVCA